MPLPIDLLDASETLLRKLSDSRGQLVGDSVPYSHTITLTAAMTEAYVDDLLRTLIANSNIESTMFGSALLAEMRDGFHGSWRHRYTWLQRGFDISIAGSKERQDFDVLVELRNALAHGGGSLSTRQRANLSSMVSLEGQLETVLHVQARGGRLRLTADSATAAVLICRRFVLHLDRTTRLAHPHLAY